MSTFCCRFHHDGATKPLKPAAALQMIWGSLGRGYAFIGNAPPNTHGLLDDTIVEMMVAVGDSIRRFWDSNLGAASGSCSNSDDTVTLTLSSGEAAVRTIALREDLTAGQNVGGYTLEVRARGGGWKSVSKRETIGLLYLHDLGDGGANLEAVRVRCTELVAAATNVTISAMSLTPLLA